MNDQIQLLRRQVRMIWPYRWVALAISTIIALIGWTYVLYMPNVYQVDAKIFIDTRSMLRPLMRGLAVDSNNLSNAAQLMKRTMLTRPNLEEVARKTDLDLTARTDKEFDKLVSDLAQRIGMSGTSKDNIYQIVFEDQDPQLAKRVVDELLNEFLETALGSSRLDTASTQKFLDEQIAEYEKRLIEAEQRLKDFKQKNAGQMPGEGTTYYGRLESAKAALGVAQLELKEAMNRRDEMKRQVEGEEPMFGMMGDYIPQNNSFSSQYDARIEGLQNQLDQMLLQYTEKHPQVIGLLETISLLESKRDAEIAELEAAIEERGPMVSPQIAESPIYREMRVGLARVEGDVAALKTRVQAYQQNVDELEKAIDTIPEVEAELKRLDRDYGLNRSNYTELLKRRESARLSEEVDEQADDTKLKVIEPPRIPLTPIGPMRVQFLSLVLAFALAVGGGMAILLAQINPRFNSSDELKEFAALPIMGVVSMVSNRRQRTERRMELAVFALMLMGLVSFYGGLVALEAGHYDLHGKVAAVVEKVL